MCNAILFYVTPSFRLTGSTINALEYFLCAYEYNRDVKLVLVNGTPRFVNNLMELTKEKYYMVGVDMFKENILNVRKSNLVAHKFKTLLVLDYMTIFKTKGLINADKIIVISEKHTADPSYFYSKDLYDVEYYGEMPWHYRDYEYRMKCLFYRYKKLKDVKEGTYINSPYNDSIDIELIKPLNVPTPYLFKSKTDPEDNLFEQFTHYVYYHADKWFDPHPRLFLECAYYEKEMYYINPLERQDGSWYRWNDLQENGIKNRTLSRNDEIICQLL
jgi:hypothetical protein